MIPKSCRLFGQDHGLDKALENMIPKSCRLFGQDHGLDKALENMIPKSCRFSGEAGLRIDDLERFLTPG
jgi:hypothetical protein